MVAVNAWPAATPARPTGRPGAAWRPGTSSPQPAWHSRMPSGIGYRSAAENL